MMMMMMKTVSRHKLNIYILLLKEKRKVYKKFIISTFIINIKMKK
jgi:hypothetical protein